MKVLCLIPTLGDDPSAVVESLKSQTMPPARIIVICGSKALAARLSGRKDFTCFYHKPDFSKSLGERIASALNSGLLFVNLSDFDMLLRIDADTKIPPSFIEDNMPTGRKLMCGDSSILFATVESFCKVMNSRFEEVNEEDTYFQLKYKMYGFQLVPWKVKPLLQKAWGAGKKWRYFYDDGVARYKFGHEPVRHAVNSLLLVVYFREPKWLFRILGFLVSSFKRVPKCDIAQYVRSTQTSFRIWRGPRLLSLVIRRSSV